MHISISLLFTIWLSHLELLANVSRRANVDVVISNPPEVNLIGRENLRSALLQVIFCFISIYSTSAFIQRSEFQVREYIRRNCAGFNIVRDKNAKV